MNTYGYDQVAPMWNEISTAQRAALTIIRNFSGSKIIHELDDSSEPNGSTHPR